MATITVFDSETSSTWNVEATLDQAVVNGSGTGVTGYYIRLTTSKADQLGGVVGDQIIEDLPANSNITREVEDSLSEMIAEVHGSMLSESMSSSSSSMWSSSSRGSSESSGETRSSQSTAVLYSSTTQDSSESSELQGE